MQKNNGLYSRQSRFIRFSHGYKISQFCCRYLRSFKDRKRRKPWRVRVTVKWILDEGKNITKQELQDLGCFETRREAEAALLQYLDGPYNVKNHNMTFEEVYKE